MLENIYTETSCPRNIIREKISPDDTSPFMLFNEIQRLFEYYSQWDERLYELANQEGSIQEMLDESRPALSAARRTGPFYFEG